MKKIIFIVEGYIKQSEANAICLKGIVETLVDVASIDIVSIEKSMSGWYGNVFAIDKSSICNEGELKRKIVKFSHMPVGSKKLSKFIAKETSKLLKKKEYDALITIVNPIEAADAIKYIRRENSKIKIILYEIDPPTNRYKTPETLIEKLWSIKSYDWAKKVYRDSNVVIHMKTHKIHFSQKKFSAFEKKTRYLDIPSFKANIIQQKNEHENIMVYAGAFYPKLRNPYPMIEILKQLSNKISIKVLIFTGNNMLKDLQEATREFEQIEVNGYISQEELMKKYEIADYFLDLGNTNSDYLPSKPFQYMGTGKPLIHFKPDDTDVAIDYIKKYKDSLIIPVYEIEKSVNQIIDFVNKERNNNDLYTEDELIEIFWENTSTYTANKLLEIIEQC